MDEKTSSVKMLDKKNKYFMFSFLFPFYSGYCNCNFYCVRYPVSLHSVSGQGQNYKEKIVLVETNKISRLLGHL